MEILFKIRGYRNEEERFYFEEFENPAFAWQFDRDGRRLSISEINFPEYDRAVVYGKIVDI